MHLNVRAHPGASRQRVEWDGAVAQVWVTPRAADGAANRAVIVAVAAWLELPPSRVRLVRGTRGRVKVLEVEGLESSLPAPRPGR